MIVAAPMQRDSCVARSTPMTYTCKACGAVLVDCVDHKLHTGRCSQHEKRNRDQEAQTRGATVKCKCGSEFGKLSELWSHLSSHWDAATESVDHAAAPTAAATTTCPTIRGLLGNTSATTVGGLAAGRQKRSLAEEETTSQKRGPGTGTHDDSTRETRQGAETPNGWEWENIQDDVEKCLSTDMFEAF
eukprot:Polyplicarium_translucidae@DN2428_c0_g1_i1.p1